LTLVRVYVPTTEGPVAVERLTREPAARSAVCVKRTTRVLPISAAYDAFVRAPSGVIEREFGPFERGAFRMDVSGPIGDGESWQLGTYIAHALAAANRLAGPEDECTQALWITGALDSDLGVGDVGHIAEKLHNSAELIEQHKKDGTPLSLFVPRNNLAAAEGSISVTGVTAAADILQVLNLTGEERGAVATVSSSPPSKTEGTPSGNGLRTLFTVLGVSVLAAGAGTFVYFDQQPAPRSPVVTDKKPDPAPKPVSQPASVAVADKPAEMPEATKTSAPKPKPVAVPVHQPTLKVFELRAATGSSCAAIQFSDATPLRVPLQPLGGDSLPDSQAKGLCGMEFVVAVGPQERYAAARVNITGGQFVRDRGLPAALQGNMAATGDLVWRSHVPKRLIRPLTYNISVAVSKIPINSLAPNTPTLKVSHKILP